MVHFCLRYNYLKRKGTGYHPYLFNYLFITNRYCKVPEEGDLVVIVDLKVFDSGEVLSSSPSDHTYTTSVGVTRLETEDPSQLTYPTIRGLGSGKDLNWTQSHSHWWAVSGNIFCETQD